MKNKNTIAIRVSQEAYDFLYDLQTNIRLVIKDKKIKRQKLGINQVLDIIKNYFKLNNDSYKELIKLYINKNEK